jgi:hypothetical protein
MFDDLLENEVAEPAAVPEPAAPRRQQNNGRAGHRHTHAATERIRTGWVKHRAKQLQQQIDAQQSPRLDFAKHVSRSCFGNHSCGQSKELLVADKLGTIDVGVTHLGKRSFAYSTCIDYGTYSALQGQAAGVARFIAQPGAQSLIAVNTFDDAAMWVKDPAPAADRLAGTRVEGSRVEGKLWKRGKTIHLPVMNLEERLFMRCNSDSSSTFQSCAVHSGSSVLCKSNAATVRQSWKDWSAVSSSGSGVRIDPNCEIDNVLSTSETWRTYIVTKDNLGLNQCIMGLDEQEVRNRLESELKDETDIDTHLHLNCHCHSAVLCTKPMTERMDDLPSKCVRLGHLHESGRISQSHLNHMEAIINEKFRFHAVEELPHECERWHKSAMFVLRASRPVRDLTEADELEILGIDNGDWDSEFWDHWCLGPGLCKAGPNQEGCGGCPAKAKRLMQLAAKKSCGTLPQTPASYRWKGMEQFIAFTYRSRREHDILLRTHLLIWPDKVVRRAEEELDRLGEDQVEGPASNDKILFKTQVRGGRSVKMMQDDPPSETIGARAHLAVWDSGLSQQMLRSR